MAILAGDTDQPGIFILYSTRASSARFWEGIKNSELLVAYPWYRRIFFGSMGTRLALALSAPAGKEDTNPGNVSHRGNWLHGQ